MLSKIENINSNSHFQHKNSAEKYNSSRKKIGSRKFTHFDKIDLSPAIKFIRDLDWQLAEIRKVDNQVLHLDFKAGFIDIKTVIDLSNFSVPNDFFITVSRQGEEEYSQNKIIADFNLHVSPPISEEEQFNVQFLAINRFFDRYLIRNDFIKDNSNDEHFKESLIEGIQQDLLDELTTVQSIIIAFVEKYSDQKISITNSEKNTNYFDLIDIHYHSPKELFNVH